MQQVQIYRNSRDTTGVAVTLGEVIGCIQQGKYRLVNKTRYCNVLAMTDPAGYKTYKASNLPAVTFSGTFPKGKRKAKHLLAHSGLVTLDIDGLPTETLPDLFVSFSQHPHILLAFISPSGSGIKAVVRVNPLPTTDLEHKGAYAECLDVFDDLATEYEFTIDTTGKDCSRLCYLSYDNRLIHRPNATPIQWDKDAYLQRHADQQVRFSADAQKAYTGEVDITALDSIDPNDLDYTAWLSVISACKHAGVSLAHVDVWSQRGGVRYTPGEVEQRWQTLQKISWGAVVNLAKANGYQPPTDTTPTRYVTDPDHPHITSNVQTEQLGNANAVTRWLQDTEKTKDTHLLILTRAAGTGKTTACVIHADRLLYIAKTTGEADTVFAAMIERGDDVVRHVPRLFNRDRDDWETLPIGIGDNERPCVSPDLCNLCIERIGTPEPVCARCPAFEICRSDGYRSQAKIENHAAKVVYAWGESVACDAMLRGHVKRLCKKDAVLIIDEVNPLALHQHRSITRNQIFDLLQRFHFPETADIFLALQGLHNRFATSDPDPNRFLAAVKAWVDGIDDPTAIDDPIQSYPIGVVFEKASQHAAHDRPLEAVLIFGETETRVPVVDTQTAPDTPAYYQDAQIPLQTGKLIVEYHEFGFLLKNGLATLDDPPRLYQNLIRDLQTFFKENTDPAQAPFAFDPKQQRFDFFLKPTLNHRRAIFNTASDPDRLIESAYQDTDVAIVRDTGTPPSFHETTLVFQLTGGNYLPRHSLVQSAEVDGNPLALKPTAAKLVDGLIRQTLATGHKSLVVAPKAFQAIPAVSEWGDTDPEHASNIARLTHPHRAEGRNDLQGYAVCFVFHHEPNHNAIEIQAKQVFRNAAPPLSFDRDTLTQTQGAVSWTKNGYTDTRVQAIADRECRQRLYQSLMRLRPDRNPNKVVFILTGEPLPIPTTPIPFTMADVAHYTGDPKAFADYLQQKHDAERHAQETGDIQAVMTVKGISRSQAYAETKDVRHQQKADRDAEVVQLHQQGKNASEIARVTGVSRGTINRILKRYTG